MSTQNLGTKAGECKFVSGMRLVERHIREGLLHPLADQLVTPIKALQFCLIGAGKVGDHTLQGHLSAERLVGLCKLGESGNVVVVGVGEDPGFNGDMLGVGSKLPHDAVAILPHAAVRAAVG